MDSPHKWPVMWSFDVFFVVYTSHQWILLTKGQQYRCLMHSLLLATTCCWTNSQVTNEMRCSCDVILMKSHRILMVLLCSNILFVSSELPAKSNLPVQGVAGLTRCFILLPWEPWDDGRSKEKSLIIHGSGTTHRRCVNVIPGNQINTSLAAIDNGHNTDSSLTHYGQVVPYRNIDLGQHWLR